MCLFPLLWRKLSQHFHYFYCDSGRNTVIIYTIEFKLLDVNTAVFFNSILDFTMYNMKFKVIHINVKRYMHRHRSAHIAIIPAICFMNIFSDDITISEQIMYLHRDLSNKIEVDVI
jgi:hypothetical protein